MLGPSALIPIPIAIRDGFQIASIQPRPQIEPAMIYPAIPTSGVHAPTRLYANCHRPEKGLGAGPDPVASLGETESGSRCRITSRNGTGKAPTFAPPWFASDGHQTNRIRRCVRWAGSPVRRPRDARKRPSMTVQTNRCTPPRFGGEPHGSNCLAKGTRLHEEER